MTRLQVVDVCHLDRPRTVRRQRHALCSLAGERAQRHEFIRHMASTHGHHGPGTGKTWGVYRFSLAVTHLQARGIPNIEPKKKHHPRSLACVSLYAARHKHGVSLSRCGRASHRRRRRLAAYFLPLFLMPWAPVLRGPLPPALAAISLRAFSSAKMSVSHRRDVRVSWSGLRR